MDDEYREVPRSGGASVTHSRTHRFGTDADFSGGLFMVIDVLIHARLLIGSLIHRVTRLRWPSVRLTRLRWRTVRIGLLAAGSLTLGGSLTGCAWHQSDDCDACRAPEYHACNGYSPGWDDCVTKNTAEECAEIALSQYGDTGEDFAEGFEQAYIDLALGGYGHVPAVPPEKYWAAHYRSQHGHAEAQRWFEGYAAGVESARSQGIGRNAVVAASHTGMVGGPIGGCNTGFNPTDGYAAESDPMMVPQAMPQGPPVPMGQSFAPGVAPSPSPMGIPLMDPSPTIVPEMPVTPGPRAVPPHHRPDW